MRRTDRVMRRKRWLSLSLSLMAIAITVGGCGQARPSDLQSPRQLARPSELHSAGTVPSRTATNCFAKPERCGYPGAHNTGPRGEGAASCASLAPSGPVTASTAGQRIENLNVTGAITVAASGVVINNVCVTYDGQAAAGSEAIRVEAGADRLTVANSTIRGEDDATKSVEIALSNAYGSSGLVALKDYIYNCGECIHYAWTVDETYVLANGMKNTAAHYEAWYFNNNVISADDDTMLNPYKQTAVLFGNASDGRGGGCENHSTVVNSLIAGGGAMIYPCGNASSVGTSTMTIKSNRFARMRCATSEHQIPAGQYGEGGWECEKDEGFGGFWPRGGFFYKTADIFAGPGQRWEGNVWDDNLEPAQP